MNKINLFYIPSITTRYTQPTINFTLLNTLLDGTPTVLCEVPQV